MERPTHNLAVLALLFVIGVGALVRFSPGVRIVDVVGLSGGVAACGAALFGVIFTLVSRKKG